jgi:RHS repeat-associated protein
MSDKSGAGAISLPKGGGAVTGMGEKFSPDLFTGTGNFSVPLALPAGRNGLQPELTLGYSTGGGNSAFGLGWNLGVPGVQRKTSKGIPRYDDGQDVFLLSGAEDLVPLARTDLFDAQVPAQPLGHRVQYRPRTEGLFARIEHYVYRDGRDYWQVRSKDGLTSYYGAESAPITLADHTANPAHPAVLTDPLHPANIFAWHLTRTVDVFGNEIIYEYEREINLAGPHQFTQTYLRRLRYADYLGPASTAGPAPRRYLCSVELTYAATRPDPFSTYDSGFEQRTTRRCTALHTYTHPETADLPAGHPAGTDPLAAHDPSRNGNRVAVKSYFLTYADQDDAATPALNAASLLHQVQVVGHDAGQRPAAEAMPPIEFGYARFAPDLQRFFPVTGALPATSLAHDNLELLSIFGNGLPDLVELGGGQPRYWRNLGQGRFAQPRPMPDAPGGLLLADPDVQFIDANGDGKPDLLVNRAGLAGYFSLTHQGQWDRQSFRRFKQAPSFSLADPEVRLLDLDGDGVTDVLRNGSRLEYFYNDPEQGFVASQQVPKQQLASFPNVSFQDPRVRLAHLCSGLQCVAMVHSGRVEYWPNLGRGRWGQRLTMTNSPVLPRGYNPAHVLLGDVDGDGLDDFLYIEHNKLTLWLNQSGNGWSAPIEITGTPGLTDASAVRLVDLLGTGVPGVLWTRDAAAVGRAQQYMFLDLTGRVKPYVLHQMDNHLGALTRVAYAPSTRYYLADYQKPATRWQTPLPMPVQVVAHVEVIDRLSGGKMTTEYSYHHGYWDGGEREFRGFGRVDQRDTQSFAQYNTAGLFADDDLTRVRVPGNFSNKHYNGQQFSTDNLVVVPRLAALAAAPPLALRKGDFRSTDFGADFRVAAALASPLAGGMLPVAAADFAPPLETRTWFHLGPVGDGTGAWQELDLSPEYWAGDAPLLTRPAGLRDLLRRLPRRHRRDAVRALRGTSLRTELYALDGTARQHRPYTVTESLPGLAQVRGLAPVADNLVDTWLAFDGAPQAPARRQAVDFVGDKPIFFAYGVAQRTTQWERGTDPMTQLSFTADFDAYGQARRQLSLALPRGWDRTAAPDVAGSLLSLGLSTHAGYPTSATRNAYDTATQYLVNRASSNTSWEVKATAQDLANFARQYPGEPAFDWQTLAAEGLAATSRLPRELLAHTVQYYDGPAFQGLGFGELGDYGALTRSEVLLLTPDILKTAYGSATPLLLQPGQPAAWPAEYPADFQAAHADAYPATFSRTNPAYPTSAAGYHLGTPAEPELLPGGYYQRAERRCYDFQASPPAAAPPRGLAVAMLDPLGDAATALATSTRVSRVQYDAYALLPVRTTDALGHVTQSQYDYRLFQARLVTDPNGNRTAYGFSPLGLLRETALLGKENANEGDIKNEYQPATASGTAVPLAYVASTWLEYDFFAFAQRGEPCWVRTTQREQHYAVSKTSDILVRTEYSDGFGRLLQTRAQAEEVLFGDTTFGGSGLPADPQAPNSPAVGQRNLDPDQPNVVVSGWQVYDNKGKVVAKYEPFFSRGFDFVLADTAARGQRVQMRYDPRGQVIRTINPDGSEQRVVYGRPGPRGLAYLAEFEPTPWETYSYDANDLAPFTHFGLNQAPAAHAFTPQSSRLDPLGRVVETRDRLEAATPGGPLTEVVMRYEYDIRGNRTKVLDALGRTSFTHVYDLKPGGKDSSANVLYTRHLDGGEHRVLFDGAGQLLSDTDAKGALTLHAYDSLGRSLDAWARDQAGEPVYRRVHNTYGTDTTRNNNGQLIEHYNEAGYQHLISFDFKGNVLEKSWQVIADEVFTSQWAKTAAAGWLALPTGFNTHWDDLRSAAVTARLAPTSYVTTTSFDALNRTTKLLLPAEPGRQGARSVVQPLYNRAGALAQIKLDGQLLVRQVAYNARGQRLLLARSNGLFTRYTYDATMSRLVRRCTEDYKATGLTLTPTSGTVCHDTVFRYDLVGNVVATTECAPESGVADADKLERLFTHDALYRLLTATGRENQPTAPTPWQAGTRSSGAASTTPYTQRYAYDLLGNITSLRHGATTSPNSFTRTFDYGTGTSNHLVATQNGPNRVAYQYDAAGNVVQENETRHFQWDAANQLRQFATWAGARVAPTLLAYYCYTDHQRAKKITQTGPSTWQVTVYVDGVFEHRYEVGSGGQLLAEQTQVLVHDGHRQLYQRRNGDALGDQRPAELFGLDDHLGSAVAQTDAQGTLVSREEYYPFGETSFGSTDKKRYRFCGKELDAESGLYYYGLRYYAPWICRFVSVDPLVAQYPALTSYQYASNRPLTLFDVDGLEGTPEAVETTPETIEFENFSASRGYQEIWSAAVNGRPATSSFSPSRGGVATPSLQGYSTSGVSFLNIFPARVADLYLFKVPVDISAPKVSKKVYESLDVASIVRKGTLVEYLPYAQYASKYDQQVKQTATRQAIAKLQQDPGEQFKGYKYYRAMSWAEYRANGGRLSDRRSSGEGPHIRPDISYIMNSKFIMRNKDVSKYGVIVEYNSSLSPQMLSSTKFVYSTLDANGNQVPGGPIFNGARAEGTWYRKEEGKHGTSFGFPGVSTQTFNSSLLSSPKIHFTITPESGSK